MSFEVALEFTLKWEGGYSNHPSDPGGATNLGITQRTYTAWLESNGELPKDVRNVQLDEARRIYYENYWLAARCDDLPMPLAMAHFDSAVNHGPGNARILLQNSEHDWRLYLVHRFEFWASLQKLFPTFGRGWTRRGADLLRYCAQHEAPYQDLYTVYVHSQPTSSSSDVLIRISPASRKVHIRGENATR